MQLTACSMVSPPILLSLLDVFRKGELPPLFKRWTMIGLHQFCFSLLHLSADLKVGIWPIYKESILRLLELCNPRRGGGSGSSGCSDGKESACNGGDQDLIPGSGRSPGRRHGNLLQYSCLENPTDRGAWWATVQRGLQRDRHDWSDLAHTRTEGVG